MKRAIFTLFQPQSKLSLLGKSALMVLFAWCCLGMQNVGAQTEVDPGDTIAISSNSSTTQYQLTECNGEPSTDNPSVLFTDDGTVDGLYADPTGEPRREVIEICPKDKWNRLKVVFTDFGMELGDTLYAFQGTAAELEDSTRAGILDLTTIGGVTPRDSLIDAIDSTTLITAYLADANTTSADSAAVGVPSATNATPAVTEAQARTYLKTNASPQAGFTNAEIAALLTLDELLALLTHTELLAVHSEHGKSVGAANASETGLPFGGWIYADCSPLINADGCLTFVFITDGDNDKSSGWEAWVDCDDREVKMKTSPSISSKTLECDESYALIEIAAPEVSICGEDVNDGVSDSVQVIITDQLGEICLDTCLTFSGARDAITDTFAIGIYKAEFILKIDDHEDKRKEATFTVQAPSLVCNDDVIIPFGSACEFVVQPDDVLENPCDTITDTMYYNIVVTIGEGKDQKKIYTQGFDEDGADTGDPIRYPVITVADIEAAGMDVCGGKATVTIERIYYSRIDELTFCNNGVQRASCDTDITFSDQSQPWISGVSSDVITIASCDTTGVRDLLDVRAIDNCDDDVEVKVVSIELDEALPCYGGNDTTMATIRLEAEDECGNVGKAEQRVRIIRPYLFKMPANVEIECNSGDPTSADTAGAGVPGVYVGRIRADTVDLSTATVIYLDTEDYICGYLAIPEDIPTPANDCGSKIFRKWKILDWCRPGQAPFELRSFRNFYATLPPSFSRARYRVNRDPDAPASGVRNVQFINEVDTEAPYFDVDRDTLGFLVIPLGPFECTYDVKKIGAPSATDDCDPDPNVRLDRVVRIEDGGEWEIDPEDWDKLPCDSFCLRWVAEDKCHEQLVNDTIIQVIFIDDVTKPAAVCTDQLHISIPGDQGARIHWQDIDAGSNDACDLDSIRIRRKGGDDPTWRKYVEVDCYDAHGAFSVEMRVWDKKGNYNTCWMTVTVEDKIPPVCEDLPTLTRYCHEFHNEELGKATGGEFIPLTGTLLEDYNELFTDPKDLACYDNLSCVELGITQEYKLTELNCGELEIIRRYKATDWGNESPWRYQTINVVYVPDWKLKFPADVDVDCGDALDNYPAAASGYVITNGSCDLFALEVKEKTFVVPGDLCMKIERTYEVINWCEYEAGQGAYEIPHHPDGAELSSATAGALANHGRFTYTQILKLYVNEIDKSIDIQMNGDSCIFGEGDKAPYGIEDRTPGSEPFECDEERTFSASANNCLNMPLEQFEWEFYENGELKDSDKGSSFTKVVQPKITYKVRFRAFDGCGNSVWDEREYKFWDCRRPTPYVLHGVAIEMSETGSVQVWAKDLDQGSYDNCTPAHRLKRGIFKGDPLDGAGPTNKEEAKAVPPVITFTCEDQEFGFLDVGFVVIDEEGNYDVVGTYVYVQDHNNVCGRDSLNTGAPTQLVAGGITNIAGENVEKVNVTVNGGAQQSMATGATGKFQFELPKGGDYTLTPEKDINPLNGVSTYDLVLISQHILGINTFDTPYKYIAADVNKSGTITAFDMVQIRQLILNITSEFPNNSSWRFVDAAHQFTTSNPAAENFNEFISVNNLDANLADLDFIAAKIGDINGNALTNSLLGAEVRNTNGTLTFNVMDRFVEAGQAITVDFKSADIATALGYQFTMNFAGLELAEVVEGVAKASNFNTNMASRGLLTTSWNGEASADEVLFSLKFKANTTGLLSELLAVNSDITVAEAYTTTGDLVNVNIEFKTSNEATEFSLYQNTPNPFNGETMIGFTLPKANTATLRVMDIQGKVLRSIKGEYAKGYNQITLDAKTLGATGVLYYQLESSDNVATRKMIIIE